MSIAEKADDEPDDEDDPLVLSLEDAELDDAELDDPLVSGGGGGGGGAFALRKDDNSDCDTEPSPSVSIEDRRSDASLDVDDAPALEVEDEVPSAPPSGGGGGGGGMFACMKPESSLSEIAPSPSASMASKACADDELADDVAEVPSLEVAPSCTESSAPRVSFDIVSTKLCNSLDDSPPDPSESMDEKSCDSLSLASVEEVSTPPDALAPLARGGGRSIRWTED